MHWIVSAAIGFIILFIGILIRFFRVVHVIEDHEDWTTFNQLKNDQKFHHTLGRFLILTGLTVMPLSWLIRLGCPWMGINFMILAVIVVVYIIRFALWGKRKVD